MEKTTNVRRKTSCFPTSPPGLGVDYSLVKIWTLTPRSRRRPWLIISLRRSEARCTANRAISRSSGDADLRRGADVAARGEPAHLAPRTSRAEHHLRGDHDRCRYDDQRRCGLPLHRCTPRRLE